MSEEGNEALTREELIEQKAKELEENFSYDGYQVVRKELFAHLRDPAVVIRNDSVTFNTACINGLEDAVYIHIMINMEDRKMVICKCDENDKDALRWCVAKPDKRKCRKMSCRSFTEKLYRDMGWDPDYRYKIMGYRITAEGQTIYIFDLSETEIFSNSNKPGRPKEKSEEYQQVQVNESFDSSGTDNQGEQQDDQEKPAKRERAKGYFPGEWDNSYGLSVAEHENALHVDMKDGYVQASELKDSKSN